MIEEKATVQAVDGDIVSVFTTKNAGCSKCNEAESCSTSVLSKFFGNKEIQLKIRSNLSLKTGDCVLLGIEEKVFIGLTSLIYFLPICGLLICAVLGQYVQTFLNMNNEVFVIALAIFGFFGSFYGIKKVIRSNYQPEKFNPVILKKF